MIQFNSNIESHGNEHQRIFHGDALEVLSQIPDESVDLIFVAPPLQHRQGLCWEKGQVEGR